jgi:hypothetical protein
MADLQKLIAALNAVSDAYQPDPNDDPDSTDDPNDDPGNDDGDPSDDPRSYPDDEDDADKENAEDEDGDDENDFSRPKVFSTVMLLQKLENESDLRFGTEWKARNQEIVRRNARLPPSRQEQDRNRLAQLKLKTAQIHYQLELDRKVKLEEKRYLEARMLQRKANLTVAEKQAEAEVVRQGQISFSRICPEAHPDWREMAAKEFRSKSGR